MTKSQTQHRTTAKGLTVRHFHCSHVQIHCVELWRELQNILALTALLNTWTVTKLENHRFPTQTKHFSQIYMYKWWILLQSTCWSTKFGPCRTAFYVEVWSDFLKNTCFVTAKWHYFHLDSLDNILLKEPWVNLPPLAYIIYICSTYLWSSYHIYVNLTDPVKLLTVAAGIWASGSSSSWIIAFIGGFEDRNFSLWSFENLGLADPAFLGEAVKYF